MMNARKLLLLFLIIYIFIFIASCRESRQEVNNGATILIESIIISGGNRTLVENSIISLEYNVLPKNASNKSITWNSSEPDYATVDEYGTLTACSPGQSVITASAKDNSGITSSIKVTVIPAPIIPMTPVEIFNSMKGQKATSYGWADRYNEGTELSYADPENFILIDDESYPTAHDKYIAFINANITNANINNGTGVISGGTVNDTQKFIIISGGIDLSDGRINDNDKTFYHQFQSEAPYARINPDIILNMGSNTTLIGINNARIMFGGIRINNRQNIIIRNITFYDAHGSTANDTSKPGYADSKASIDALAVQGNSNGVWIDHCYFTDGICNDMIRNYNHDGAFDIPQGKNITVSWCEFTNHDKVMLVAGSDDLTEVMDRQITLHHNYFHNTTQRMPRTRGTQMHVYNNYYNYIGVSGNSGYAMGPGVNAHFVVENNYFGYIMSGKITDWYDNAQFPAIVWSSGNNVTVARSSNDKTGGSKPWEPEYFYTLDNNACLPLLIPAGAGTKLTFKK